MTAPAHHAPGGGYRVPWLPPGSHPAGLGDVLRWRWQRLRHPVPPDPDPALIPTAEPRPAVPGAPPGELRLTWIGHATFLIQVDGCNILTDPVLSKRASPLSWVGPARLVPPALEMAELPPIHAVLLSHGHYDHLDRPTVRGLRERFGDSVEWITPLGYRDWFRRQGVERVRELDWWEATEVECGGGIGPLRVTCCPAQHWSRRGLEANVSLWASFALRAPGGHRLYFGGDSGFFDGYADIGGRLGPFDAALLPIGAYEPRWFMMASHLNPEDAVQAWRALGGQGAFVGMHWGTFRLTDEAVLEPPVRTRQAWESAGLAQEDLHLPAIGETLVLPAPVIPAG